MFTLKKNAAFLTLGIVSVFFLAGCVSIKTAVYPNASYLPTPPEKVQILKNFPPNPATYQVIGEVYVPEMNYEDSSFFEKRLRKKVAQAGGHAVVLFKYLDSTQAFIGFPNGSTASVRTSQSSGLSVGVPAVTIQNPPPSYLAGQTALPSFSVDQSFSGRGYLLRYRQ